MLVTGEGCTTLVSLAVMLPRARFDGPVWRLIAARLAERPLTPAGAPEGRFHYGEQIAIYASLSEEGTRVAIQRYVSDGVSRVTVPMWLSTTALADIRGIKSAAIVWQDLRKVGRASPT